MLYLTLGTSEYNSASSSDRPTDRPIHLPTDLSIDLPTVLSSVYLRRIKVPSSSPLRSSAAVEGKNEKDGGEDDDADGLPPPAGPKLGVVCYTRGVNVTAGRAGAGAEGESRRGGARVCSCCLLVVCLLFVCSRLRLPVRVLFLLR